MMSIAILIAIGFCAGATSLANARRVGNGRVWLAFAAGAVVALLISVVSRPFVQLAGQLGGWESDAVVLYVLSSTVHGTIAELFKITAALLLLSSPSAAFGRGEGLGAAIGAGAAMIPIAQFLQGALAISSLGLPGGQSLPQGVLTGLSLVLLSAATTGLGAGFAARGRLATGIALALALTLAVDPGLRLLDEGAAGFVARVVLAGLMFVWLLARSRRGAEATEGEAVPAATGGADTRDAEPAPEPTRSQA
jgi:hypothetical protein